MTAEPEQSPSSQSGSPPAAAAATAPALPERPAHAAPLNGRRLAVLSLTALGVVYGDLGTSPLYTIKECFNPDSGVPATAPNVYGILSLIVWTLTLIVSVKYIYFILRADNQGEGGILALLALIQRELRRKGNVARVAVLVGLGLFGAALLYGDGVITPSITVLGAIEGLEVATPLFKPFVVPLSAIILVLLFLLQRNGTDRIGKVFGPVMLLWFASIGALGTYEILREPAILKAINPWYGVLFFAHNGWSGFFILGAVVLCVTGAEALYADMGHFGKSPIRFAWYALVFPALLLNYFGQGALLLRDGTAASNPFFNLVPKPLLYPMVVLATAAAVIASQALISGAFSLTRQAMQLGYCPRVRILHTSRQEAGQIYIPEVNALLLLGCLGLVLGFRSSNALAAAYGIAVTGTMVITTLLFYFIAHDQWGWPLPKALAFLVGFLAIDFSFLIANSIKIEHGGWFPIVVAVGVYTLMSTWKRGRTLLHEMLQSQSLPMDLFLEDVKRRNPPRVPGTAVFMTSDTGGAPIVLLHHLKHNKVLHEQVVLLSILTAGVPDVPASERVNVEPLGEGFFRVLAHYGFMQTPNVPDVLGACGPAGIAVRPSETSFYLGREELLATGTTPLARWRKYLYAFMARNARAATQFYGLPPNRVVELGAQLEF